MTSYRKKPVVVEALLYDGDWEAALTWINNARGEAHVYGGGVLIETLEGAMTARVGDWIIKGVRGEFYPCKPDIFEETYERIEEGAEPG